MVRPLITIRIPHDISLQLSTYMQQTGASKTEVVVSALAQYLGCVENLPLSQRVAELEARMAHMEASMNKSLKSTVV